MTELNNLFIIIAEDDTDDAETIFESFNAHPSFAQVDIVANGKELLDSLQKSEKKPDIILTDINMPIVSGIEALFEINAHEALRKIPAFVYSTAINPVYEEQCRILGTKGFIIKPFSLKEFNDIPEKILDILRKD
jgi:CheY-like chemotaxis protein